VALSRLRAAARVVRDRRWREIADVARAQVALGRAQLLVWTRPTGQLVDASRRSATEASSSNADHSIGERLSAAVQRATRYGLFNPQCLVRAVALNRMLEANGVAGSTIRIGVRWAEGQFIAHAWVEQAGVILGDTAANTATFVPLTDVRLSAGRTTR
jgi:Transglutaminase-like superfamily